MPIKPNVVKNSDTFVDKTIGINNVYLGINSLVRYGPTSETGFWNGYSPSASGYTIYIKKDANGPSIYSPANDAGLIETAYSIARSRGDTGVTGGSDLVTCLAYLNAQPDMICVNADYPEVHTDGLVLFLDAAFTPSYPKGNTKWKDLSVTADTANLVNGVTYSTENSGSLIFSNTGRQYVEVSDLGNLNRFTVECWFRLNTLPTTAGAAAIVTNVYTGSVLNFSIGLNNSPSTANICGGFYDGSWRTTSGFSPQTDIWYHVVVTYDGATIIQYLDKAVQSTLQYTGTPSSSGAGIRIARRWDAGTSLGSDFIDGEIPVVRIYNKALNAAQVEQNYTALKDRYPNQ